MPGRRPLSRPLPSPPLPSPPSDTAKPPGVPGRGDLSNRTTNRTGLSQTGAIAWYDLRRYSFDLQRYSLCTDDERGWGRPGCSLVLSCTRISPPRAKLNCPVQFMVWSPPAPTPPSSMLRMRVFKILHMALAVEHRWQQHCNSGEGAYAEIGQFVSLGVGRTHRLH